MFVVIRKWPALYGASLLALALLFAAIAGQGQAAQTAALYAAEGEAAVLVLDPGHGGEDGGAVAADGTVESGINLAIAHRLEQAARLLGIRCIMTRREDVSIHDQSAQTLRQKKASDLKNRVALCNGTENAVLLSIHQNSLPQSPRVHGAQVFYNGQPGSEALAQAIQKALNDTVNGDRPRSAKLLNTGVYLMEHTQCPGVLVECGFLSNPEETGQLRDPAHQAKLALVILSAAASHLAGGKEGAGQGAANVVY